MMVGCGWIGRAARMNAKGPYPNRAGLGLLHRASGKIGETTCSSVPDAVGSPAVPPVSRGTFHLEGHVVVLSHALRDGQVAVALVFGFAADIGDAFLFVLEDVEDFPVDGSALHLVGSKRSVDLLVLLCVRRSEVEAGLHKK